MCFAKDWHEDPTSCNHVLRELARHNRVLWVNSISTRAPKLGSGRDLRKVVRHLSGFLRGVFGGATPVDEGMWLFTPFVLPFHHRPWAVWLNRRILRLTLGMQRRRLGMRKFQLWTFVPTSAEYVGRLGEDLLVYYCTDEWSGFKSVDGRRIEAMVRSLATRADVVFATSRPLVEKLGKFNSKTYLASHGVQHARFARALEPSTVVPADVASMPRPLLGFYGLIEEWMDLDLIVHLAKRHPEWSIVLIGKVCVDVAACQGLANVHFIGRRPHEELPAYCKAMDVALIPHKVNELTRHMNPIKLREYLSAGLSVVSTDVPEMRHFPESCLVARDFQEFESAIVKALSEDSVLARQARSNSVRDQTWERKVQELGTRVMQAWKSRHA